MKRGIDFPLLINAPKKLDLTLDQFDHLSYIGIGSLFCSYKFVICKRKDHYQAYMSEGTESSFINHPRFKDIKWFVNRKAEVVNCVIPFDHDLCKVIESKFSHLIIE